MNAEFHRPVYLAHLFDWTEAIWSDTNWLFTKLDSNPNLQDVEKYLSPQLNKADILFSWKPEGLWIPGSELGKSFISDNVVVPFSACYIFDSKTTSCTKPRFNMTTDTERSFTDTEIKMVSEEIISLKALGYAADGCGLQWVSFDDKLSRLIRQGFNSWQKMKGSVLEK